MVVFGAWLALADPSVVLVSGADGRGSDLAFLAVGLALVIVGVVLAVALG